jgi:hypothetical protein
LLEKVLELLEDIRNGKRFLSPSDLWDDAKGAGIITTFSDFEVFELLIEIG